MTAEFAPPQVIPFQIDGIAEAAVRRQVMIAWDTGTGKGALALGVSCLALQDGFDIILLICEQNKLQEWIGDDVPKFTRGLSASLYHGPRRAKVLESLPDILITTYETARNDAGVKRGPRSYDDGPLLKALAGKRVMVVYDEISVLSHRSSQKYKAHFYMLGRLREWNQGMPVLGLTATPVDTKAYDNVFSAMRLISPEKMPLVKEFDRRVIAYRDVNRHYMPVWNPKGVAWFRDLCQPLIMRRRKTDPEVVAQFPPFTEQAIMCPMHSDQREIYAKLEDLAWDDKHNWHKVPGLAQLLYQLAGDPQAVAEAAIAGNSQLARVVWEELGDRLIKCSSAKFEQLQRLLDNIIGNGHKAMVFTYWGQSVLPVLKRKLGNFEVFTYHGEMTQTARERAKAAFKAHPGGAVLLSSDAGARGINMPEAPYIIEYDVGRTPAVRTQRAGRGHRLGGGTPVTMITLVAEQTVEDVNAVPKLLDRTGQQDYILSDTGSDGYVTAEDRREMFSRARRRR